VTTIPLDYLKRFILPTNLPAACPGGMIVPYEGGYALLALLAKGENTLAKDVLDKLVTFQNTDGSWYQQYYPYKPFDRYEDRKVDSGTSLTAWAMADSTPDKPHPQHYTRQCGRKQPSSSTP